MNYSANFRNTNASKTKRIAVMIMAMLLFVICLSDGLAARASSAPSAPVLIAEAKYDSQLTHPYNNQTTQLIVRWKPVSGATAYHVYIRGGKYSKYTRIGATKTTAYKLRNLDRATSYRIVVRAQNSAGLSPCSESQVLKTARMNYDQAGWQALCRITYHEVGTINTSAWDRPIVYVADCCVNRYVSAKYAKSSSWKTYYARYNSIQDVIYKSGGFMSSAGLTKDGATYARVTNRVKTAVYGALYAKTELNNIANDFNIYFWCNRSYKQTSNKIAYSFKIPWGYFYIYRSYWG